MLLGCVCARGLSTEAENSNWLCVALLVWCKAKFSPKVYNARLFGTVFLVVRGKQSSVDPPGKMDFAEADGTHTKKFLVFR